VRVLGYTAPHANQSKGRSLGDGRTRGLSATASSEESSNEGRIQLSQAFKDASDDCRTFVGCQLRLEELPQLWTVALVRGLQLTPDIVVQLADVKAGIKAPNGARPYKGSRPK
jgi:hypothetical protein